jgi:hypothetical protein
LESTFAFTAGYRYGEMKIRSGAIRPAFRKGLKKRVKTLHLFGASAEPGQSDAKRTATAR